MRLAVVALAALAILFAPATGDEPGSVANGEPVHARIIAPTLSEAMVGHGPRFGPRHLGQQRTETGRLLALVLAAAAAAAFLSLLRIELPGRRSRVLAVRTWIPRGPPPVFPS